MNYGIGNVKDKSKSLFTTTTAPTESGDVITLATSDIVESGFKVGDYLAYVDSGNISALYSISAISSGTATLSLVGAFGGGGGKQLYQHNIVAFSNVNKAYMSFSIINDNSQAFTFSNLANYIKVNYNSAKPLPCNAIFYYSNSLHIVNAFYLEITGGVDGIVGIGVGSDGVALSGILSTFTTGASGEFTSYYDTVITL